ncbi:MAG: nitrate reductase delta subunit [Planctomycetota bacterium]|jgi:nitrate reductase delta subunit
MKTQHAFNGLAVLLEYPEGEFSSRLDQIEACLSEFDESSTEKLSAYFAAARELDIYALEELYTRTFDINPVCSLEVGWQIFGETYDRGGFLIKVSKALASHGVPPSKELGDHLPQMLRLFGQANDDTRRDLAIGFLIPAITKMLEGFSDNDGPYFSLLSYVPAAIDHVVTAQSEQSHA